MLTSRLRFRIHSRHRRYTGPAGRAARKTSAKGDCILKTNYVLIDYENVQPPPAALIPLKTGPFKLIIFLGPQQIKISRDLATVMQEFGNAAEYVSVELAGKNSVDFHIAFQIGRISAEDPDSFVHVISQDADLDLLIPHLKKQKIYMLRQADVGQIPLVKTLAAKTPVERVDVVIQRLKTASKPTTLVKLRNSVNAVFGKQLSEAEIDQVVVLLKSMKILEVDGAKVSYPD